VRYAPQEDIADLQVLRLDGVDVDGGEHLAAKGAADLLGLVLEVGDDVADVLAGDDGGHGDSLVSLAADE
jgi:hypothetical protein